MKRLYVIQLLLVVALFLALAATMLAQGPAGSPGSPPASTPEASPTPVDEPIGPAVVGGSPADPAEYPWQVAIVRSYVSNPLTGQFCGGSLIDPRWVLTAAHCVVEEGLPLSPASLNVVFGVNNLSDGPTTGPSGQRLGVVFVIVHPDYNPDTDDSDIALLRLGGPAVLGPEVETIAIAGLDETLLISPGITVTVTGWGNTTEGGAGSDTLLEVDLPLVSNEVCNGPEVYNGKVTPNMLCAGFADGGQDSCQGDSGGPLITSAGLTSALQIGVVSWGDGCARPNRYGVYTRVSQFEDWINGWLTTAFQTIYLPIIYGPPCLVAGESDNIADAISIASGQQVCGQVSQPDDRDDVYRVSATAGQTLTITTHGLGGDIELYLFAPDATDVNISPAAAFSTGPGNDEFIQYSDVVTGFWYIDILSAGEATEYSLRVTVD